MEAHTDRKYLFVLTEWPCFTTPNSFTIFGWWNWPIMAASCNNLILSSSDDCWIKAFTATSYSELPWLHKPLLTVEKAPSPTFFIILQFQDIKMCLTTFVTTPQLRNTSKLTANVHRTHVGMLGVIIPKLLSTFNTFAGFAHALHKVPSVDVTRVTSTYNKLSDVQVCHRIQCPIWECVPCSRMG